MTIEYEVFLSTLDNTSSDIIENAKDPRDAVIFSALAYVDKAKRDGFSFDGFRFDFTEKKTRIEIALNFENFEGNADSVNDPDPLYFYVDIKPVTPFPVGSENETDYFEDRRADEDGIEN